MEENEKVESSKSAVILKTIYAVLIVVILINCIILITSIILKTNTTPTVSRSQIINLNDVISQKEETYKLKTDNNLPVDEENEDNSL